MSLRPQPLVDGARRSPGLTSLGARRQAARELLRRAGRLSGAWSGATSWHEVRPALADAHAMIRAAPALLRPHTTTSPLSTRSQGLGPAGTEVIACDGPGAALRHLVAALLAGDTAVWTGPEALRKATRHLPPGVLTWTDASPVELVRAGPDAVVLAVRPELAREVAAHAGLARVHLDLQGQTAALVAPDADLEVTAAVVAWGLSSGVLARVHAHVRAAEVLTPLVARKLDLAGAVPDVTVNTWTDPAEAVAAVGTAPVAVFGAPPEGLRSRSVGFGRLPPGPAPDEVLRMHTAPWTRLETAGWVPPLKGPHLLPADATQDRILGQIAAAQAAPRRRDRVRRTLRSLPEFLRFLADRPRL